MFRAKVPCNDEEARVAWGDGGLDSGEGLLYCGRFLGVSNIPNSDGICGPNNGPQCQSCHRLQQNSRLELLGNMFPSLSIVHFIAALRSRSGSLYATIQYLIQLQAPHIDIKLAFPGLCPEGLPTPPMEVSIEDATRVRDVMGPQGTIETAMAALRRSSNDVELAIHYVLDTPEPDLVEAAADDTQQGETFCRALGEFIGRRHKALLAIVHKERIPAGITMLQDMTLPIDMYDTQGCLRRLELAAMDGHFMVARMEDDRSGGTCPVCASPIFGYYSGSYHCRLCQLCEGCIQAKVVYKCPNTGNGGHLHTCKLQPMPMGTTRRNNLCNIKGGGCLRERNFNLAWYCPDCEFDVCSVCIAQKAPVGFDRRFGKVFEFDAKEENSNESVRDDPGEASSLSSISSLQEEKDEERPPKRTKEDCHCCRRPFDEQERFAAARWENDGTCRRDDSSRAIVGNGPIGSATMQGEQQQRMHRILRRRQQRRQRQGETRLPELRAPRAASVLENRFETALSDYEKSKAPAAHGIHHAEELLRLSQGTGDSSTTQFVCQAVGTGKIDIAGTVLLAHSYGLNAKMYNQKRKRDAMRCFCGDIIDKETAPEGAVGCLNGHGMHPSCAADHLLGSGDCPTCREPLFFPSVSLPEAEAAKEFFNTELQRRRHETEANMRLEVEEQAARGLVAAPGLGDVVRVSSDREYCKKKVMEYPEQSGWCPEMETVCGAVGRVRSTINVNGNQVAVQVQTQALPHSYSLSPFRFTCGMCNTSSRGPMCTTCSRCQNCCQKSNENTTCPKSSTTLYWTPSTLTLIGRAGDAVLWDKSWADKEFAIAAENEQHIVRLRAELKAISTARATIEAEIEKAAAHFAASPIINEIIGVVSAVDLLRADHLLLLTRQWDGSEPATTKRKEVESSIRQGDIDSASRTIRHFNSLRFAEAAKWADAGSKSAEYIVEDCAKIDLLAWPSADAPRTGYSLDPRTRFLSKSERLDSNKNLWLEVDQTSAFKTGEIVRLDPKDKHMACKLVNSRVSRGPDWSFGNQDGGAGNIGTIVGIGVANQQVYVRWISKEGRACPYRAGEGEKYDLVFADSLSPQGWLCTSPGGLPVVRRARSALRCCGCGDGIFPSHQSQRVNPVVKDDTILVGDVLLVAATLKSVRVASIEGNRVLCSISKDRRETVSIWYRREDLVHSAAAFTNRFQLSPTKLKAKCGRVLKKLQTHHYGWVFNSPVDPVELNLPDYFEVINEPMDLGTVRKKLVTGVYTRLEEFETDVLRTFDNAILYNIEGSAVYNIAREMRSGFEQSYGALLKQLHAKNAERVAKDGDFGLGFASCTRGHPLHARCLQGALLAGNCCPAPWCNEPLWFPKVRRLQRDEDVCCGNNGSDESNAVSEEVCAGDLVGPAAVARARNLNDGSPFLGGSELKMCPACFAGPLQNDNCNDMSAHHGQCVTRCFGSGAGRPCRFTAPSNEIASSLLRLTQDRKVADVLPKCPEHNVVVMFNGCMSCGHLFTDKRWSELPEWDPSAKILLDLNQEKRKVAGLLAGEIRKEMALLGYERNALENARNKCPSVADVSDVPSPPPPSIDLYPSFDGVML